MPSNTIPEIFFDTVQKYPDKAALLYKKNKVWFPMSYKDLAKKVNNLAIGFQFLKIKKGDRIAILSNNRPEWAITDLAIMSIGAVTVPLHTTFNPQAIKQVLNHSQAKIIIVSDNDLLYKVLLVEKKLRYLKKIIFLRRLTSAHEHIPKKKILTWRKIMAQGKKSLNKLKNVKSNPDDVCSIIYTSGTTGNPKGVMLTHTNFLSNVEAVNIAVPVKTSDIFLSFLPLSHVLERLAGHFIPLLFGATIAYAENVKQLPHNLKEVKPTILIAVPRIFEKFHDAIWDKVNASSIFKKGLFLWALKQKKNNFSYKIADLLVFNKIRQQLGGRLRLTISGGASLSEKIARFFSKIGILILEGYGLTETSPVISVDRENDFKLRTVGKILFNVKVKISPDKEILVQGPNITKGYFRNRKETKSAIDKDGWFHTGDLGFMDSEGFLTVIGRKKEMIVTSGGKNVWPERIENELNNDRFVSSSIVIGDKRKFISALIIPDWQEVNVFLKENNLEQQEPEKLTKNSEIIELFQKRINKINQRFCDHEKIKKFRLLVNEFSQERGELTPTLKLRRHIILHDYRKEIEKIYS